MRQTLAMARLLMGRLAIVVIDPFPFRCIHSRMLSKQKMVTPWSTMAGLSRVHPDLMMNFLPLFEDTPSSGIIVSEGST
jgi:hypothetical protein